MVLTNVIMIGTLHRAKGPSETRKQERADRILSSTGSIVEQTAEPMKTSEPIHSAVLVLFPSDHRDVFDITDGSFSDLC